MKLAALSSGGKDSLYAAYLKKQEGCSLEYLLSMISENPESYMFHHPNIQLTRLQAQLMYTNFLSAETKGVKEEELEDLSRLISQVDTKVDGIVTGAIESNYQKDRIERICAELGLECFSPIWHVDAEKYWEDLLKAGFKVMVSSVSAYGLDEDWLGRVIDWKALERLKKIREGYQIHLAFEGGEAETLVLDCPMFSKKIEVVEAKKTWTGQSGTYLIKKTRLIDKL